MKLKKLELYGFKSFAQRTEIVFDEGITGIVGPNGSGKSNIGDAVRWVLGETSSRQLRAAGKTTPVLLLTARDAIADRVAHPLYKKILKRTKKFKAHDENNEAGIGDRVEIMETRKISKDVNWRLVKIIEKAK